MQGGLLESFERRSSSACTLDEQPLRTGRQQAQRARWEAGRRAQTLAPGASERSADPRTPRRARHTPGPPDPFSRAVVRKGPRWPGAVVGRADRHCGPSAPVRRRPLQPRLRARGSSTGRGSGASEPVFGSAGPGEALLVCAQRETADAGRHTRQGCYARPVAVGHAACKSAAAACRAARQRARSCTWAGPKSSESRMVSRFLLPHPPAHTPASCIPRFFLSSLLSPCACACVACARLRRAGVLDRTRATWQLPWPATPTTACNS